MTCQEILPAGTDNSPVELGRSNPRLGHPWRRKDPLQASKRDDNWRRRVEGQLNSLSAEICWIVHFCFFHTICYFGLLHPSSKEGNDVLFIGGCDFIWGDGEVFFKPTDCGWSARAKDWKRMEWIGLGLGRKGQCILKNNLLKYRIKVIFISRKVRDH